MHIFDERLGQVLSRRDHVRDLPSVNPVAHVVAEEIAHPGRPWDQEIREGAWLWFSELGANEAGSRPLSFDTAVAVLSHHQTEPDADPETELRRIASTDSLLRIPVDALTGHSEGRRRPRSPRERHKVASALVELPRTLLAQEQPDELRRAYEEEA